MSNVKPINIAHMKTIHYLVFIFTLGVYVTLAKADSDIPAISIEEAIKKAQVFRSNQYAKYAKPPKLPCFISRAEYKPDGYWSIFWSGEKGSRSCISEIRVFNDGQAIFAVGY